MDSETHYFILTSAILFGLLNSGIGLLAGDSILGCELIKVVCQLFKSTLGNVDRHQK